MSLYIKMKLTKDNNKCIMTIFIFSFSDEINVNFINHGVIDIILDDIRNK